MKLCKDCEQSERAPGRSRCYRCYGRKRRASEAERQYPEGFRLLHLDIETRPTVAYTWGLFKTTIGINQILKPGGMMCFAASWHGSDEMEFYSEWHNGQQGMVLEAWRLLDSADAVCHYYGSAFDVKHLNAEFLMQGFPPPRPYRQIDLKLAVAKQFRFPSNKLQFVAEVLGLEGKEEHEGFSLWAKCLDKEHPDHADALTRMESYNRRDVELLKECYEILLPWLPSHPSRHLYEDGRGCPNCGADADYMVDAGYYTTSLSKFKQFRCFICSSYFRSSRREMGAKVQQSML